MIVSFWNCSGSRSGVTTSAASTALFYTQRFQKKVALFENHVPEGIGLADLLLGKKEETSVFEKPMFYGKLSTINYMYGLIKSGFPIQNISESAIKLLDGQLHYFRQEDYGNHTLLDYELNKVIEQFLDVLEQKYEIIFVDLKQFDTLTTKRIIEKSNLIILNLLPEEKALDALFFHHEIDLNKFYFIFNKCCKNHFEKEKLISAYPIQANRVSYIPYNERFQRTCRNGNLQGFLQKHRWATAGEKSFEIIYELRRITGYIEKRFEALKEVVHERA